MLLAEGMPKVFLIDHYRKAPYAALIAAKPCWNIVACTDNFATTNSHSHLVVEECEAHLCLGKLPKSQTKIIHPKSVCNAVTSSNKCIATSNKCLTSSLLSTAFRRPQPCCLATWPELRVAIGVGCFVVLNVPVEMISIQSAKGATGGE